MIKKLTVFIIILTLAIGTLAFAGDFDDIKDTKYEEAVDFLAAFEVINGFGDGTFRPDEAVTRGQMAKMITIVLGYKDFTVNLESTFEDTKGHWSEPYVEVANSFDIVVGYDENTFGPNNNISYSEAVTMIIRTLGYTDSSLEGEWPYDYLVKATDIGVLDNVSMLSSSASRGDVAIMINNALDNYQVRINEDGYPVKLEETLFDNIGTVDEDIDINEEFIKDNQENSNINLEEYKFHNGDIYYNEEEKIVHIGNLNTEVYKGTVTSLSSRLIFVKDDGGNTKPFEISDAEIIFNNDTGRYTSLQGAEVKVVYQEEERNTLKVRGIIGEKVTNTALATSRYNEGSITYNNINIPTTNGQADLDKIEVWGDADNIFDIRENDFLYLYESDRSPNNRNYLGIEVVRNSVEGTLRSTSTNNDNSGFGTINGIQYDHSDYYQPSDKFSPGYYVRAYLDGEGKVVKYDFLEYLLEPDTYGLVLFTEDGNHATLPKVAILTKGGRQVTYGVPYESELVVDINEFNFTTYSLNLNRGEIVKYSINGKGNIEKIIKKETQQFSGTYNENTGEFDDLNRYINSNSIIYHQDGETWKTISSRDLSDIVSGKIITSAANNSVDVFILKEGIKTEFANYIYAPILNIEETLNATGSTIYKFNVNIEGRDRVLYTENDDIKTEGLTNTFSKINITNSRISSVEKIKPELTEKEIQGIYRNTLVKIDGTYWEFSGDCEVYTAEKDEDNNLIFTGHMDLSEVQSGDMVNIYDLEGNFDGVIDHVILVK